MNQSAPGSLAHHLIRMVMSPAVRLMDRLRIPFKFLVFALAGGVALVVLMGETYIQQANSIEVAAARLDGIARIHLVTQSIQQIQLHRGLSAIASSGNRSVAPELAKAKTDAESVLARFEESIRTIPLRNVEPQSINTNWLQILQHSHEWTPERKFAEHTRLISQLQYAAQILADHCGLSVIPETDTHYLLDTATVEFPNLLETLAQIRGLGGGILASGFITPEQAIRLRALMTRAETTLEALRFNLMESARYNPSIADQLELIRHDTESATKQLFERVDQSILSNSVQITSLAYFEQASATLDKGFYVLNGLLLPSAKSLIQQRQEAANKAFATKSILISLLVVFTGYLALAVYISTIDNVRRVTHAAERFSNGEFAYRVVLDSQDELRTVGQAFNRMAKELETHLALQKENEDRLRAIIDSALDAVIQMGADGRVRGWSSQAEKIFGWSTQEALGSQLHELIVPKAYREAHVSGLKRFLSTGVGPVLSKRIEIDGLHKDGTLFPIELTISAIHTAGGMEFNAFVRDIRLRKQADQDLRIAAIAFESDEGIAVTDARGRILRANKALTTITGYSFEEIAGKSPLVFRSPRQDEKGLHEMRRTLTQQRTWQGELLGQRKEGEDFPEWVRVTAVENEMGRVTHYVLSFVDITERKRAEDSIFKLAFYDSLTELPNRSLLMDRLNQAITSSQRSGNYCALLFIDLDNFKQLNDTRGHEAGDQLLAQVGDRLRENVRQGDTVSRLSGDEFVVLLLDLSSDLAEAACQVEIVGEKALTSITKPFDLSGGSYEIGSSIGATLFKGSEKTADEILKQADMAMYQSKDAGRRTFRFFDPIMQSELIERANLESMLREAIADNQFQVHYQAQVDAQGKVVGAEALVRWHHPETGHISPAKFIPLAETTALILPLGFFVLNEVCKTLAAWAKQTTLCDLAVAVNISPLQFRFPHFVEQTTSVLEHHGVNPKQLKLEITEGILVRNPDEIATRMKVLKNLGISFSMDDFGTGYSSLSYLKRLPLDQLKIDQSFVRDVLTDPNDAAIAKTIVALGKSLGMHVIAEGVETEAQRAFLHDAGCYCYQGYLFSRPIPRTDFESFVINHEASRSRDSSS